MSSPLSQAQPWQAIAPGYVTDVVPLFEPFAHRLLDRAAVGPGTTVVDVACGPGTVAFLAAARGARVSAVDFSAPMIEALQARLAREPAAIDAQVGDGMALPLPDAAYQVGVSQFGLMFFPDRDRGFRELLRVLVPGGCALVTSWQPMSQVVSMATFFMALMEDLPPAPPRPMPLVDPVEFKREMEAAGFVDVTIEGLSAPAVYDDVDAFLTSMARSNAALIPLRAALGEAWPTAWARARGRLVERFGDGRVEGEMPAWLGFGRKPG